MEKSQNPSYDTTLLEHIKEVSMFWRNYIFKFFLFFLLGLIVPVHTGNSFFIGGDTDNPFSILYDEGPILVEPGQTYAFRILFQIPEDYYLYEDKLIVEVISPKDIVLQSIHKPEPILKEDPFFKKTVSVYFNEVTIDVLLQFPDQGWDREKVFLGQIKLQGCSDKLCYRPMQYPVEVSFISKTQTAQSSISQVLKNQNLHTGSISKIKKLLQSADFDEIAKEGLIIALLIAFLGGFLTDFTPCVWPMIPITLAIIGVRKDKTIGKNLVCVLVLVLGMAVMYSLLGVVAASFGRGIGFLFQHIAFLVFIDLILFLMAFSLFGFFEIQLPPSIQLKISRLSTVGLKGIFVTGLTMGLLAAPCVGPVVGPLLIFVAKTGSLVVGFVLLLSYALGMGFIFIVFGGLYGVFKTRLVSSAWTLWLKRGLGALVFVVALYYAHSIFEQFKNTGHSGQKFWIGKVDKGMTKAATEKKAILIDFFATWCPPCVKMDHTVFSDKAVQEKLTKDWVAIKVDCSRNTPECQSALNQFGVIGWPTIIFLNSSQEEVERLVGKVVSVEEMLLMLEKVE